jgi:signal transduction histidine kinase
MWMDFALRVAGHPYAKFSLNCSDDIRPETFEFWSAVATVASSVLELLDRATAERVYISQWLLHNIQSMLAPLSGVHEKYREYAEAVVSEKLHGYNGELLEIFNEAFDRAEQRKRFFRKIAIASQPFDFPAMLHSILQRRRIGQRSGVFGISLVFRGDKEILRDAMEEMLNNSIREYQQMLARSVAGESDDRPTVTIRLERFSRAGDPRDWIRLVFEDNGPGIPANKALTIFNGSKNGHERGGFGLLFVADVIRAHGGSIRVVPTSGRGATFEIEMPEQTQEQEDSNATLVV